MGPPSFWATDTFAPTTGFPEASERMRMYTPLGGPAMGHGEAPVTVLVTLADIVLTLPFESVVMMYTPVTEPRVDVASELVDGARVGWPDPICTTKYATPTNAITPTRPAAITPFRAAIGVWLFLLQSLIRILNASLGTILCGFSRVDSNSNGTLYVSTNAVVGDDVCIAASMSKSTIVSFEVIGPTGVFLSTPGCINSAFTAVSCEASWNTARPDPRGNTIQPGDYELIATGDLQSLRANFTLSANPERSQTCINQSSSSSTSSGNGQGQHLASAVTPSVFFNNSIYQGPSVTFTVMPGSHASMAINVSYPWQNVQPPPTQGFCVEFSFTVGPFPASSNVNTIPGWMHVSISPPSVEIPYGSSASVNLLASVDNTASKDSGASFELLIHYLDPASGNSVFGSYVVSIQT